MFTYSRGYLQTYRQHFQTINLVNQIEKQILQTALCGKTRFVYQTFGNKYNIGNGEFVNVEDIIHILKTRFPDSLIEYQEVKNIHDKIDCGIVIDWS